MGTMSKDGPDGLEELSDQEWAAHKRAERELLERPARERATVARQTASTDTTEAMSLLAEAFHILRGAPGVRPWDSEALYHFAVSASRAWLALASAPEQRERLAADVAATDERRHCAAVWELALGHVLDQLGHTATPHPRLAGVATTPDWFVSDKFYLEATLATDSDERVGEDKRLDELVDALEDLDSPDFLFNIEVGAIGRSTPSKKKFKSFVQRALAGLDRKLPATDDPARSTWEDGNGWEITIEFTPAPLRERAHRGNVAAFSGIGEISLSSLQRTKEVTGLRKLSVEHKIRTALAEKAGKYGVLEHPLVVAVNVTSWMGGADDVKNALFGTQQALVGRHGTQLRRLSDGLLRPEKNRRLSAVLAVHRLDLFAAGTACLYLNPWASHLLEPALLPFDRVQLDLQKRQLVKTEGSAVWADLLRRSLTTTLKTP